MVYVVIAAISCLIQLVSAVLAAGLIRLTERWLAWSMISAALLFMTVRRFIPLYTMLATGSTASINPTQEYLGLVISILIFAGIIMIRPLFYAIKRSEAISRENEARLEHILNKAPFPIIVHAEGGDILRVNKTLTDLTGFSPAEIPTIDDWIEKTHIKKEAFIASIDRLYTRSENKDDGEFTIRTKDNRQRVWDFISAPLGELPDNRKLVISMASDITGRKQAETHLIEANKQIQEAFDDLIEALARTVETQDEYTASHQRCVTDLSVRIARELNLSEDQVRALRMAATVHDVGKIYVPSEILNKPGPMSTLEFELSKAHTLHGNNILKSVRFPLPIAEIVYQHHERIDGSGYPRGLKSDEIMIEAKILAVADVVNAMSADRPYRPALGIKKALKEIEKNRGTLYDPQVVDVCVRLFEQMDYSFVESRCEEVTSSTS